MTKAELLQSLFAEARSTSVGQLGPYGNIYTRPMRFPDVGSIVGGHTHNYDHLTVVMRGTVLARAYDTDPSTRQPVGEPTEAVFKAPAWIEVAAKRWHEFIALEPDTYAVCVFALRDKDGKVTETRDADWSIACSE